MNTLEFENDIPLEFAIAAHSGTSHVPNERGRQECARYAGQLQADYEYFRRQAEEGRTQHLVEEEFARYRHGLASKRPYSDRYSC
jgi:hypothetical protein